MSKKIIKFLFILPLFLFTFPTLIMAIDTSGGNQASGVSSEPKAPAGSIVYICTSGAPGECSFPELVEAVKKVVNWGTLFAIQFSVIVIAYAGFTYMTAGDNASGRAKANKMLRSVVIGIVFIIAAWLIVTLILNSLGVNSVVKLGP